MRSCLLGVALTLTAFASGASAASDQARIGLPTDDFATTWTSLPTDRFSPMPAIKTEALPTLPMIVADDQMQRVLDEAFASAGDPGVRRETALDEMETSWPQSQRTAFQALRDAQLAYADGDSRHSERFAALVARVVDGSGRSAAVDGSAAAALETAYSAKLTHEDDAARTRTAATQKSFVAYRDAFAAFADARSPGIGPGVSAELDRQRTADLGAADR